MVSGQPWLYRRDKEELMGITIIILGIIVLTLSGYFFGRVLVVNPEQKRTEDNEQMEWLGKYQEAKV